MAIKNKSDLKYYIKKDRERNKLNHPLLQRITFSEDYPLYAYLKNLRFYEYYLNNPKWYNLPFYIFIDSATDALQEKITYLSHLIQLGGEYSSCIQVSEE